MSKFSSRSNPTARSWYKTKRWLVLRGLILEQQPLCNRCGEPATVVDHMLPHKGDIELFFGIGNLQSLCKKCHDSWKARMENGRLDSACSEEGYPADPRHPWRSEKT